MPYSNYCKKCNAETPVSESCPRCGTKLTRAGERLSLTVERVPVRDWFSWNTMLRVVVPVIGVVLLATVLAEAIAEGGQGVQAVFVQGFFWTLLGALGLMLLFTLVLLSLQGRETVRYVLDGKGAHAYVYVKGTSAVPLYARLTTPQAAAALQQDAPEPMAGYHFVRRVDIAWAQVRRVGFWPETHTILLYQPSFWLALCIRAGQGVYAEAEAHVRKKAPKRKRARKRRN